MKPQRGKITSRKSIMIPRELRKEQTVVITRSKDPNVLMFFAPSDFTDFMEAIDRCCESGTEDERRSARRVARYFVALATSFDADGRDRVYLSGLDELLGHLGEIGDRYVIKKEEVPACYLLIGEKSPLYS